MDNVTLNKNISILPHSEGAPNNTTTIYDPACFAESQEESILKTLHWVSSSFIGTIFVITGITGNILSLVVWKRTSLQFSSTRRYLSFLSLVDLFVLLLYFLLESVTQMEPFRQFSLNFRTFYSYVGYPIFRVVATGSLWLTVCVTVDRYIHVCHPLKVTAWSTKRRVHLITGLLACFCILSNIPYFLTYAPTRNVKHSLHVSALVRNEEPQKYDFWLNCIFFMHLACFVLVFMNFKMIRHLKTTKLTRPNADLTRMILYLSFASLFHVTAQCVSQCSLVLFQVTCEAVYEGVWSMTLLVIVIRSSVNIVFYTVSFDQFRTELKDLFLWRNENEACEEVTSQDESDI